MTTENILTTAEISAIREIYRHFPQKSAACIEGLKIIQRQRRWVSDEAIRGLAEILEMSPAAIDSVATYYSLIFRRPVGRNVILLCNSVSCWIMGCDQIAACVKKQLAVDYGETTTDDRYTLLTIPCLGTCDHAPAMIINEDLHRDLTAENIGPILQQYQ
ncbi:MAG: NADH-quinone oxidoreductase subunit NuoE [Puia sp.]|nr:NADH-quinone oxidoreductase subunit NuoE [Puia sp.]